MSEHQGDHEIEGGGAGRGGPLIGVDGEVTETVSPLPDCTVAPIVDLMRQRMAETEREVEGAMGRAFGLMSDLLDENGGR